MILKCCFLHVDINECLDPVGPCHVNADCIDTDGSFDCVCQAGYTGDGVISCASEYMKTAARCVIKVRYGT